MYRRLLCILPLLVYAACCFFRWEVLARPRTFFVAHDGYISPRFPGNTIEAIYQAIGNNIDVIELVIRTTRDDVPIVISHSIFRQSSRPQNSVSMEDIEELSWYEIARLFQRHVPQNHDKEMDQLLLPYVFKLNYILEKFSRRQFILKIPAADPYKVASVLAKALTPQQWSRVIILPHDEAQAESIRHIVPTALVATSHQEFQSYANHFLNTRRCDSINPSKHYWITINPRIMTYTPYRIYGDKSYEPRPILLSHSFLLDFVSCVRANFPHIRFILTDPNNYDLSRSLNVELLYVHDVHHTFSR